MFCPADTLPWMYGLTGVGIMLVAAGVIIAVSKGRIDLNLEGSEPGPEVICWLFGAFPLLIGGMMVYYSKKWFAWSLAQKRKTKNFIIQEKNQQKKTTLNFYIAKIKF